MYSYKGGLCFQPPKGSVHAITDNSMGGDETGHTDHIDNAYLLICLFVVLNPVKMLLLLTTSTNKLLAK